MPAKIVHGHCLIEFDCQLQRLLTEVVPGIDIYTRLLTQEFNGIDIVFFDGQSQWRLSGVVADIDVDARLPA